MRPDSTPRWYRQVHRLHGDRLSGRQLDLGKALLRRSGALWNSGLVRAAGSLDILIAGYAIANDATVLAADHDFDHIAKVTDLSHEYVAPSR